MRGRDGWENAGLKKTLNRDFPRMISFQPCFLGKKILECDQWGFTRVRREELLPNHMSPIPTAEIICTSKSLKKLQLMGNKQHNRKTRDFPWFLWLLHCCIVLKVVRKEQWEHLACQWDQNWVPLGVHKEFLKSCFYCKAFMLYVYYCYYTKQWYPFFDQFTGLQKLSDSQLCCYTEERVCIIRGLYA